MQSACELILGFFCPVFFVYVRFRWYEAFNRTIAASTDVQIAITASSENQMKVKERQEFQTRTLVVDSFPVSIRLSKKNLFVDKRIESRDGKASNMFGTFAV